MVSLLKTLTIEASHVIVESQLHIGYCNYNHNWPMSAARHEMSDLATQQQPE